MYIYIHTRIYIYMFTHHICGKELQKKTKAQARGTAFTPVFSLSDFTNCVEKPTKSLESLLQGTGLDPDAKAII